MKKKIVISLLGLCVFLGIFIFVMDWNWGEVKSEIKKTNYTTTTDSADVNKTFFTLKLFDEGNFTASHANNDNLELLFNIDGLKKTTGRFDDVSVNLEVKHNRKASVLSVKIKSNSIFTDNSMRDESLVSDEFFNSQKFPLITYESDSLIPQNHQMMAYGKLNLLETTKTLNFPFDILGKTQENKQNLIGVSGSFEFDRTQYGMPHEKGVGDVVKISFYVDFRVK